MPVIITGSGLPTAQGGNYRISKTDLMRSLNYLITSPDFKINAPADQHQADVNEMENLRMLNSALVQDRRPRHGLLARLPASAQIPGGESVAHGRIEYHSP